MLNTFQICVWYCLHLPLRKIIFWSHDKWGHKYLHIYSMNLDARKGHLIFSISSFFRAHHFYDVLQDLHAHLVLRIHYKQICPCVLRLSACRNSYANFVKNIWGQITPRKKNIRCQIYTSQKTCVWWDYFSFRRTVNITRVVLNVTWK